MQSSSSSRKQLWITIAIAAVVFIAGILLATVFRSQLDFVGSNIQQLIHPTKTNTLAGSGDPTHSQGNIDKAVVQPTDEHALKIQWATPVNGKFTHVDFPDVLLPIAFAAIDSGEAVDNNGKPLSVDEMKKSLSPYGMILGSVQGGAYDGYTLIAEHWTDAFGMGSTDIELYTLADQQQHYVLLNKHGASSGIFSSTSFTVSEIGKADVLAAFSKTQKIDMDAVIPDLASPQTLSDTNGNSYSFFTMTLSGGNAPVSVDASKVAARVVAVDSTTNVKYTLSLDSLTKSPHFYLVLPDGRTLEYEYDIPWQGTGKNSGDQTGVKIFWNDGTSADGKTYSSAFSYGCGMTTPDVTEVAPKMTAAGSVKDASGKTFQIFEPIWTEKDTTVENSDAARAYANYIQRLSWDTTNKETASFAGFMKMHPIYFWQDPFGRWLRFTNENVQSAAECGKPVIYLYPTETTSIDVSLAPKGGFTYTEPVYKNGWRVTASPDGTLVNRDDGKTYPYLFWEGRGAAYTSPNDFWVVKKNDVHTFLNTTLAKIGLNAKETADFEEFWEPKMQAAPYYKIGFHGTSVMNEIAPMTLSEKPDTVLRVLMDYTELSAPMAEHPPKLPSTPVRNGFTVIEWGGVLR